MQPVQPVPPVPSSRPRYVGRLSALVGVSALAGTLVTGLWMQHSFAGVRLVTATVTGPTSTAAAHPSTRAAVPATKAPRAATPTSVLAAPARAVVPSQQLVVLGDSVPAAAGCGCTGFGTLLARSEARTTGQDVSLTNAASDGLTTSGLLTQLADPTLAQRLTKATLVTITIGANDFDQGLASRSDCASGDGLSCYTDQLGQLPSSMSAVLTRVRSLTGPAAKILVTGYWNVFLDGDVGAQKGPDYVRTSDALTRRVNAVIAAAAPASRAEYVDLYSAFKPSTRTDDTPLLASDGDHPSASGHELIAAELLQTAQLV